MHASIFDPAGGGALGPAWGHRGDWPHDPSTGPEIMDDDAAARAKAARETCPFLTAKQTAFHLGIARSTLKAMRLAGKGPRCRRHGRTWRYHIDDIEAWSAANARGGDHG
jgi:hypothetical protein